LFNINFNDFTYLDFNDFTYLDLNDFSPIFFLFVFFSKTEFIIELLIKELLKPNDTSTDTSINVKETDTSINVKETDTSINVKETDTSINVKETDTSINVKETDVSTENLNYEREFHQTQFVVGFTYTVIVAIFIYEYFF
jgi:hypothetical protein